VFQPDDGALKDTKSPPERELHREAATGATPDTPAIIVIDEYPYLHEADEGMLATEHYGKANDVGSFWTRRGDVEVDLVDIVDALR
jgi:hypothetical protein